MTLPFFFNAAAQSGVAVIIVSSQPVLLQMFLSSDSESLGKSSTLALEKAGKAVLPYSHPRALHVGGFVLHGWVCGNTCHLTQRHRELRRLVNLWHRKVKNVQRQTEQGVITQCDGC